MTAEARRRTTGDIDRQRGALVGGRQLSLRSRRVKPPRSEDQGNEMSDYEALGQQHRAEAMALAREPIDRLDRAAERLAVARSVPQRRRAHRLDAGCWRRRKPRSPDRRLRLRVAGVRWRPTT
jgi:hypothetical protein